MASCGFAIFALVLGGGLGQPDGYRYRIGWWMQIFEGAEGVIVFVAMDLETHRSGLVREPPFVRSPVCLYRIDVGRDGTVKKLVLKPPGAEGRSFPLELLYVESILNLPEDLSVLHAPPSSNLSSRVGEILRGRIEPLSAEDTRRVLGSIGVAAGGDRTNGPHGWQLLDRRRPWYTLRREEILSPRHQVRLRFQAEGTTEAIIAESSGEERWAVPLLSINAKPWRSYHKPPAFQ